MTTNKSKLLVCSAWTSLAAFALLGCSRFEIENLPPKASAQVLVNGAPANTAEAIPFMGAPLSITLDGTASADKDGSIKKYYWLQTDVPNYQRYGLVDAGAPAAPAFAGDPPQVAAPQLSLGEGTYQYSLWVTDDGNLTSDPATVEFTIETPTTYMPNAACVTGYMAATTDCSDCVCTPAAMTGCLETYQICFENTDPMFSTLCSAVVGCAQRVGCVGSACYTGGCMMEITAAGTYMGASLAEACALPDAAANPCAAASQLGACSSTGTCMAACN